MKTLALAILISGLFVAVGAGAGGAIEERPLALTQYDGSRSAVAERYGIEVVTRRMPIGDTAFECLVRVSPKHAGNVKAPLLGVTDTASGGNYSLRATLAWEPIGDGLQLRLYSDSHLSLRQIITIPFAKDGFSDNEASGVEIDLGSILKNQK